MLHKDAVEYTLLMRTSINAIYVHTLLYVQNVLD